MTTNPRAVVLFDGDCPFCRQSVRWLQRLDWLGRLEFRSCRDPQAWPELPPPLSLDSGKMIEEMHLVSRDRRAIFAGFSAFRRLSWMLPLTCLLSPWLYVPGVLPLGNRVYRWIAKNRFNLVPCDANGCTVPRRPTTSS